MQYQTIGLLLKTFVIILIARAESNANASLSNVIIVSNKTSITAVHLNRGSFDTVLTTLPGTAYAVFDVLLDETVFYCDEALPTIKSVSNKYSKVNYPRRWKPKVLKIDYITKKFYIIDEVAKTINVIDETSGYYGIVLSDLHYPSDLALDPEKGLMFIASESNSILKAHMSGENLTTLGNAIGITCLVLDRENEKIYWVEEYVNIHSMNYEGTEHEVIVPSPVRVDSLTFYIGRLFWFSEMALHVVNVHGRPYVIQAVISSTRDYVKVSSPTTASADAINPCQYANGGCQQLCMLVPGKSKTSPDRTCACRTNWQLNPDNSTCSPVTEMMLYTQDNFIRGRILDESKQAFVDAILPKKLHVESLQSKDAVHFDYDLRRDLLFYSDDHTIFKTDIREEGPPLKLIQSSHDCVLSLALDWITSNLYFVQRGVDDHYLRIMHVGHSYHLKKLITFPASPNIVGLGAPASLIIHPLNALLYFTIYSSDNVKETSLYSTNTLGRHLRSLHSLPFAAVRDVLAIDYKGSKLYYSNKNEPSAVYRLDLDGANHEKIDLSVPVLYATSIYVHDDWIFVPNLTDVWRFDKDTGLGATRLLPKADNVRRTVTDVRVLSPRVQLAPEWHPCAVRNGDCQQFCLANPVRKCACEDGMYLSNRFACSVYRLI